MRYESSMPVQGLGTQEVRVMFEYPCALAVGGFFCANRRFAAVH